MTLQEWIDRAITPIIASSATYFFTRKKNKREAKKIEQETTSLDINDRIIVNRFNKEEYEELLKAYIELEKKYKEMEEAIRAYQAERDEWRRKYNVFKNIKTIE